MRTRSIFHRGPASLIVDFLGYYRMSKIRGALLFVTGGKYITAVVGLGTTALVSRLVTPYEYGIAVLGMSTLAVAGSVRELGSAAYVVQVPELTEARLQGVFTINLMVTAVLTAGAIAQTFVQPLCAARTRLFVGQRPASASLYRGYFAGLCRQGPVLAVTLSLTERARAALGLAPM